MDFDEYRYGLYDSCRRMLMDMTSVQLEKAQAALAEISAKSGLQETPGGASSARDDVQGFPRPAPS